MEFFTVYAQRCFALLSPEDRRRWLRLVPLVLVTSAIEAVGTVAIFVLVASLTDPETVLDMPIVGKMLVGVTGAETRQLGVTMVVLVAVFYVAKSVAFAITEYAHAVASSHTASNLSIRLLRAYLQAPYLFHLSRNSSDLVHTATQVASTTFGNVIAAMVHIATEALVFVAILGVLLFAAPWVTLLASMLLIAVGTVLVGAMRRSSAKLGEKSQELGASVMRHQAQALSAIDEITVLGRSGVFAERFAQLSESRADVDAKSRFLAAVPRITVETVFICGALFATVALMLSGASSGRTVSLLGLFAYAGFRIIPSANRILMHIHTVRFGQAGIERIRNDLRDAEGAPQPGALADPGWEFTDRVVFSGASLSYPDQETDVLDGVDLTIHRGESLAIVGQTGSGKSSLIRLLVGLLSPTRGTISVDGLPLDTILAAWRQRLGYVPQEVHLVEDSLRRNIAFGVADGEIDEAAVGEALRRAQLAEFVSALPDGLNTTVGDRGIRLSGGERQRVGIARALYHCPHVLVLDEATSSLDPRTEAHVLSELRSELEEWTLIAVTHRVASVRGFDRIVFVDAGKVQAVGTFEELAADVEGFRRIARLEAGA